MKQKGDKSNCVSGVSSFTSFLRGLFTQLEYKIAFKAGVAATISLYLGVAFAHWLDRPDTLISGTWCVMSTFVVLQAHLGGTYRAAWGRFLGVLIGSLMGGLFTSIFGSNAITLGVSVVLTILACSLFQIKDSIRIACLSLSIVMILWGLHPSISPWLFGWYRFLDSTLGILIAVVVSHTLWPTQATKTLRLTIAKTVESINHLFQMELSLKPPSTNYPRVHKKFTQDIEKMIANTRSFLIDSELELLSRTRRIEELSNLIDHLENIFTATSELSTFHTHDLKRILDEQLQKNLLHTIELTGDTFKNLTDRLRKRNDQEPSNDLRDAVNKLNEELNRFRLTHTTRNFERHEVEKFFVFFYNLRLVIEELLKMEEKVYSLMK